MRRFALIGSGNVASALGPHLVESGGLICLGVWSRSSAHADALANKCHTQGYTVLETLISEIGKSKEEEPILLLISVSDDALPYISDRLPKETNFIVCHTSGSTPIEVLDAHPHRGVIYPLQTFSKSYAVSIPDVPIYLEYSDEMTRTGLYDLTRALGSLTIREVSSSERVILHMAAVFGCNFVNHLFALTEELLSTTSVPFSDLSPLLHTTLNKALAHPPHSVQTGPAVRRDQRTIDRHLSLLQEEMPRLVPLYDQLSRSIQWLENTHKESQKNNANEQDSKRSNPL